LARRGHVVEGMSLLNLREFGFLSETLRYEAFIRAYRSEHPEDAEALRGLYESPDPLLPLIALQYLEELPEKAAIQALVRLIESDNDIVSRAARAAYLRNHYPGKARLLKQLVFSKAPSACRFAVRTLSRAGFSEILPMLLRELPEREGVVRAEMIEALRYLPDRRSIPVLLPMAASPEEPTRFQAVLVLSELQARTRALPVRFFLKMTQDTSDRVRRAALEALQRFPSQRVAPLILETASDENEPEAARVRAIRSLGAFPSPDFVRPLTQLAAKAASTELRLSAEVALRGFPADLLTRGLLGLLEDPEEEIRNQAAVFAAELVGREPGVSEALLGLWAKASDVEALSLVDALRVLGSHEAEEALASCVRSKPALSYSAASALAHMRGAWRGAVVLDLARDQAVDDLSRQALLDRFARRGPDMGVRDDLLPYLRSCLTDPNDNVRYLGLRALAWYQLDEYLDDLLELFARELNAEVVRVAVLQAVKGLGRDPLPLARAASRRPKTGRLVSRVVRVISSQGWDRECADALLEELALPPSGLLVGRQDALFAVLIHLIEHGSVTLPRVWTLVGDRERLRRFMRLLSASLRSPKRGFPALPLDGLEARMGGVDAGTRALFYEALAADGRNEAAERLTALLLRETDGAARKSGAALLRGMLEEAVQ
jgi:HEAT repeat protein